MYRTDNKGGNQPQTAVAHSLAPANVLTLPAAGNNPKDLRARPIARKGGGGCTDCAPCRAAKGMGDLTTDLSTLGWGGYLTLGVGAYFLAKVLFTGRRARQRRAVMPKVDEGA